jgi:hypothetical protein
MSRARNLSWAQHRARHGHHLHRPRLRRQAAQELKDLADGRAQLPTLLPAGPDRHVHLLLEPIKVAPNLGDSRVLSVRSRRSFCESLAELAQPRLDPGQRQMRRPDR